MAGERGALRVQLCVQADRHRIASFKRTVAKWRRLNTALVVRAALARQCVLLHRGGSLLAKRSEPVCVSAAARVAVAASFGKPRKGGWQFPAGAWLRGELREVLLEHLRGQGSMTRSYYEPKALDRVIDDHLEGRRNHETLLWTLLNLEIWHRALPRG